MAVASLINYEGPNNVLVWKSDVTDFNTGTQLIVHESQEAVFFKDGAALDLFGSGRHQLTTNNLPLLRRIYEKLTGNQSVFHCEVYYINKAITVEMLWGTNAPIQLEDPKYGILIDVKSFGSYKIQISDSRKFLIKTVGTVNKFTAQELQDYFRNEMVSKVKAAIARAIAVNNISILEIAVHQEDIAAEVKRSLAGAFEEYGVELKQFIISTIKSSEENLAKLRTIKEARAETLIGATSRKQAMDILGTDYREQETLEIMKEAARHQSDGGLVGLGVGFGLAPAIERTIGSGMAAGADGKTVCPVCRAENAKGAKFCTNCGAQLAAHCPNCGHETAPGAKFCPECGARLSAETTCPDCGTVNAAGAKFCTSCGKKLS